MIKVFQLRTKIFVKKAVLQADVQQVIASFLDSALLKENKWKEFHKSTEYKLYCFDSLFPIENSKQYEEHRIYTFTIRTVRKDLAEYFMKMLPHHENKQLKGLVTEIKIIPYRPIEKLYSITPVIVKTENGYWKNTMTLPDYEKQLFENLIKKYQQATNQKIDENFEWSRMITFLNKKPIAFKQKTTHLLGDKIEIYVADNPQVQRLAHFSLGVALGTANGRGAGFCNVKWY